MFDDTSEHLVFIVVTTFIKTRGTSRDDIKKKLKSVFEMPFNKVRFLYGGAKFLDKVSPNSHTFPVWWLTVDCEVHPAAIVEGVVLLLQHQDPALVPALVLWAYRVDLQGGLPMQRGSTCTQMRVEGRGETHELPQNTTRYPLSMMLDTEMSTCTHDCPPQSWCSWS